MNETTPRTYDPIPEDPRAARLAIAREVLALLDAGAIVPTAGAYLIPGGPGTAAADLTWGPGVEDDDAVVLAAQAWKRYPTRQLAEVTGRDRPACGVCAVGGLLVAAAGLYDRCRIGDLGFFHVRIGVTIKDRLPAYGFSDWDVDRVEAAYEASVSAARLGRYTGEQRAAIRRAAAWGNTLATYGEPDGRTIRLRAIMQNIVDHGGDLAIPGDPEAVADEPAAPTGDNGDKRVGEADA